MKILGINTATNKTAVALVELQKKPADKKPSLIFAKTWESDRDEAEKLIPAISAALKKGRPDGIIVIKGPGAFTGLRIGVTAADTLAFALKIPVSGISTYDFLRARVPERHTGKTALLLKAGGQFAAVLTPKDKKPHRFASAELKEFFIRNPKIRFVVGDMNAAEKKKFPLPKKIRWLPEKSLMQAPKVFALVAAKKSLSAKSFQPKSTHFKAVAPEYLMPPKITDSKKPVFAVAHQYRIFAHDTAGH